MAAVFSSACCLASPSSCLTLSSSRLSSLRSTSTLSAWLQTSHMVSFVHHIRHNTIYLYMFRFSANLPYQYYRLHSVYITGRYVHTCIWVSGYWCARFECKRTWKRDSSWRFTCEHTCLQSTIKWHVIYAVQVKLSAIQWHCLTPSSACH